MFFFQNILHRRKMHAIDMNLGKLSGERRRFSQTTSFPFNKHFHSPHFCHWLEDPHVNVFKGLTYPSCSFDINTPSKNEPSRKIDRKSSQKVREMTRTKSLSVETTELDKVFFFRIESRRGDVIEHETFENPFVITWRHFREVEEPPLLGVYESIGVVRE